MSSRSGICRGGPLEWGAPAKESQECLADCCDNRYIKSSGNHRRRSCNRAPASRGFRERFARRSGAKATRPTATTIWRRPPNFPSDSRASRIARKESRRALGSPALRPISGAIREATIFCQAPKRSRRSSTVGILSSATLAKAMRTKRSWPAPNMSPGMVSRFSSSARRFETSVERWPAKGCST